MNDSNDREVVSSIPEVGTSKSVKDLDLKNSPTGTALGLKGNIEEDNLVWEVSETILQMLTSDQ